MSARLDTILQSHCRLRRKALTSHPASVQDSTANQVSIAAVAADGADNTYAVAVNEATRFGGFVRIYSLAAGVDGAATTIGLGNNLGNAANKLGLPTTGAAGTSGWSMPSSTLYDGPGAPGGYGAGAPF